MLSVLRANSRGSQHGPSIRSAGAPRANEQIVTKEHRLDSLTDGALTVAQIIFVNAVLSGDNALVIALTAQQLPVSLRKRAVLWGSLLAVFLQVAFAILVGQLLEVPGLRLAGAIALIVIARKLVGEARGENRETRPSSTILGAILTILVANLAMSLDNVLAVGALSRGLPSLIALGIGVSALMLLAASALVIALIERYRWLTVAGAGILACTAAGMICEEPLLADFAGFAHAVTTNVPAGTALAGDGVPQEIAALSTDSTAPQWTRQWSFAIYGLALTLCFGNLRWWAAIQRFERERESVAVEPEAAYVHG